VRERYDWWLRARVAPPPRSSRGTRSEGGSRCSLVTSRSGSRIPRRVPRNRRALGESWGTARGQSLRVHPLRDWRLERVHRPEPSPHPETHGLILVSSSVWRSKALRKAEVSVIDGRHAGRRRPGPATTGGLSTGETDRRPCGSYTPLDDGARRAYAWTDPRFSRVRLRRVRLRRRSGRCRVWSTRRCSSEAGPGRGWQGSRIGLRERRAVQVLLAPG
jgi:hypothetical protein